MYILGGARSDFARHLAREGADLGDLTGELVDGALADAALDAADVQTIHVANAFGELFAGQSHLGALPATVRPALWGVPAVRHEAACASGTIAVLAAMAELAAGFHDVALVIGVEQERNVPGEVAARHLGAAAWVAHEDAARARFVWPHVFARVGDAYAERWGLDRRHLIAYAEHAFARARTDAHAQTRAWTLEPDALAATGDDPRNPVVDGMIRRYDCAQVTDGGAALVLASPAYAAAWARRRGRELAGVPRIAGWGLRTASLSLDHKLARATDRGALLFPHVADAVADARRRAARDRDAIAGYELHDCFTTTAYLAIDHLGLAPVGESWRAIEDPAVLATINPGGGLIGGGHPVGATGVRMTLDAARRVAAGASAIQTLNLGGSATTIASVIVSA